jgi:glucose/arabinose dehydrogenase
MVAAALLGLLSGVTGVLGAPRIELQPMLSGLEEPVHVTHARDGSGRLFVVEQPGRIKVVGRGSATPRVFLDIRSRVLAGGEQGLLGLAFHPGYAANGRFYVNYTRRPDGATVIAEYHVSANDPDAAAADERIVLVIPQPFANHNGGMIAFGPDGLLYIGMGDGGSGFDPDRRAQNVTDLLGKILRIDVDPPAGFQAPYASPPDNPFAGPPAGRDEIYAVGFRNPWRFSFDRATGALYAGDVGQNTREEIDVVVRGGNYGWPIVEGTLCLGLGGSCATQGLVAPVAEYTHTGGRCAVTGGYVYRGDAGTLPAGAYTFADYCSGEIFLLDQGVSSLLLDTGLTISSFGEDEAGELYVTSLGGSLHRLVSPDAPTLALRVNQPELGPGQTLRVAATVRTGEVPIAADAYLGFVGPDRQTVTFVSRTAPLAGAVTTLAADARTFIALARGLTIPARTDASLDDLLVYGITGAEPPGPYTIFLVLARPNAFDDGRVDPGDLQALAVQTIVLRP